MKKEILIATTCAILILISPLTFGYNIKTEIIKFESFSGKSPVIQWNIRFGGKHAVDECKSVRQTSDNGYILCGWSNYYNPYGWYDGWLVKTDTNSEMIWNESYGTPDSNGLDDIQSIEQTIDRGYIFCGSHGSNGAWLCKIDCNGSIEWDKSYDIGGGFVSVKQAPDGGYVAGGHSEFGKPILMKTYSNGTEQWRSEWAFGKNLHRIKSIDVTSDNGFILTGGYTPSGSDYFSIFLIKTDSNGIEEFNKTFDRVGYYQQTESVRQTSDGGYILAGSIHLEGTPSLVFLIKTDSDGNEIWNRTYHSYFSDKWLGEELQLTDDGGFIIIATEDDFYPCSKLIKTDAYGEIEWDLIIGGFEYNDVKLVSVQQTTDGGYILGGGADEINSPYLDYYLMKIDIIDDNPPDKPELDGPSSGRIYAEHTFTASTTDPDGDDVYYIFDWSDNSNSDWLGPYKSGEEITVSHRWTTFEIWDGLIRVRTKDVHNVMSEWSDPIEFTVPRNRITNNFLLLRLLERIQILKRF